MTTRRHDRVFAGCGIGAVALQLGGFVVGAVGGAATVTPASSPAEVARELAAPAGTGVWVGAYLGLLSFLAFLAFAIWAAGKLGGGLVGAIACAAAASYATLGIAAWAVFDAVEFRAGHGMDAQLATALANVNEALYLSSWFPAALFVLAAGALAITAQRRALGWAGVAVALLSLLGAATPTRDFGQDTVLAWMAWIVWASVSLARARPDDQRVTGSGANLAAVT